MSDDFDFGSGGRRGRRREAGHGGSAFATMLGGSLGCVAAVGVVLVGLIVGSILVCGGCVALTTNQPAPTKP